MKAPAAEHVELAAAPLPRVALRAGPQVEAVLEDEEIAAALLEEVASLSRQRRSLADEGDCLRDQRAAWQEAASRLDGLEHRCADLARSVLNAGYEERRPALYVLGVRARVWSTDHGPRFEVTMNVALDHMPISDPRPESGGGHAGVHVDENIRRSCAGKTDTVTIQLPPTDGEGAA